MALGILIDSSSVFCGKVHGAFTATFVGLSEFSLAADLRHLRSVLSYAFPFSFLRKNFRLSVQTNLKSSLV